MENLADLVEKAKRNTGDMELLIERFTPLIRHLAHRLPYEYQDAEQNMKLTFLQLIHKIKLEEMHSREDKCLLSYIAAAMKNRCFHLRNKYYREKSCEQLLDDTVSLPQDDDILFEEMIELEQFCSFLTKLQKQILIASTFMGIQKQSFLRNYILPDRLSTEQKIGRSMSLGYLTEKEECNRGKFLFRCGSI